MCISNAQLGAQDTVSGSPGEDLVLQQNADGTREWVPSAGVGSGITELTGDVTAGPGSGSVVATIATDAVTNAKAANMAQATIKGRAAAAGTGDPTDLTANQVSTVLDTATDPFVRTSAASSGITQLTGDVTAGPGSGSQPATIANDAVLNAKLANMAAHTFKARKTNSTGDPEDATATEATALLDVVVGDSGAGGTKGLVPAPGAGDAAAGKFLKADGTFAVPSGTGITQLTGDVTAGPGSGSQPATIPNDTVTYAKMQNVSAASKLIGRGDSGSGDPQEITLGSNLSMSGTTLNGTGGSGSGNISDTGAQGSEPGSPNAGDLYLPNDGLWVERYSGSAWIPWGPIWPLTAPDNSQFSWVNQGGATLDTTGGVLRIDAPAGAGDNWRVRKKTAPSTPYTLTALIIPDLRAVQFNMAAVAFRESATGKYSGLAFEGVSTPGIKLYVKNMNSVTSAAASPASAYNPLMQLTGIWLRLAYDGTNLTYSISFDGIHFRAIYGPVAKNTFFTTAPDELCFAADANNASNAAGVTLVSWKEA